MLFNELNIFDMKLLTKFRTLTMLLMPMLLVATVFISCDDDDDAPVNLPTEDNIVAIAQATPELSSLVSALTKYPDLVNTLSGPGTFTVFAPTNARFHRCACRDRAK